MDEFVVSLHSAEQTVVLEFCNEEPIQFGGKRWIEVLGTTLERVVWTIEVESVSSSSMIDR